MYFNVWRVNAHNAGEYESRMHCLRWAHFNYKTSILPDRWTVGEKSPNVFLNLNRQYNATCSVWPPESRTSAKSVFVVIPSVYYFISRNKPLGITSRSQPIDRRDVGHRISPTHYRHGYCMYIDTFGRGHCKVLFASGRSNGGLDTFSSEKVNNFLSIINCEKRQESDVVEILNPRFILLTISDLMKF